MDHSHHMDNMDMPTGPRCQMNMLWNTTTLHTCIVFRSWHIYTYTQFVLSLLAIVLLGVLFEWLRVLGRKVDLKIAEELKVKHIARGGRGRDRSNSPQRGSVTPPTRNAEEMGLLTGRVFKIENTGTPIPALYRLLRTAIYGSTVFLSFFLMLVFMTYNAYFITATVLGAMIGHYIFAPTMNVDAVLGGGAGGDKGMACH